MSQPMPSSGRDAMGLYDAAEDEQTGIRRMLRESFPPPPILPIPTSPPRKREQPYRVAVACDLSELSRAVLQEGLRIVLGHHPAELHVITVAKRAGPQHFRLHDDPTNTLMTLGQLRYTVGRFVRDALDTGEARVRAMLNDVVVHIGFGDPAERILDVSRDMLADLVVLGSRGHRGLQRKLSGSVSRQVMARSEASVLIARPDGFAHGEKVPPIDPPRTFRSESHLGPRHTYRSYRAPVADRTGTIQWGM